MTILNLFALFAAGLAAGGLTTIAGLGGGILLIAGLSLVWSPAVVLGVTAPALFVGNASRAAMLAKAIDWAMVSRFAVTGVPTALAASLVAIHAPTAWIQLAIAALLLGFVAREVLAPRRPATAPAGSPWLAAGAGAIAGTVSGLTGGAGFVATPIFDRLGLEPRALVATTSACMGLVHLAKGVGFGMGQVLTPALWPAALVLAGGIVAGNAVGARWLAGLSREAFRRLLLGALTLAALQLLASAA
ncbi:MAG: sulfite exporter TauE/SafE family protein [Candidatus Sericytochromatia bacterium]